MAFMDEQEQLIARAIRAYFNTNKRIGRYTTFPGNTSGIEEVGEHDYVVLRNVNGILAVYRVKNDGRLKRLKRWPKALEEDSRHPSESRIINFFGTLLPVRVKVDRGPKSLEQQIGCRNAL